MSVKHNEAVMRNGETFDIPTAKCDDCGVEGVVTHEEAAAIERGEGFTCPNCAFEQVMAGGGGEFGKMFRAIVGEVVDD